MEKIILNSFRPDNFKIFFGTTVQTLDRFTQWSGSRNMTNACYKEFIVSTIVTGRGWDEQQERDTQMEKINRNL